MKFSFLNLDLIQDRLLAWSCSLSAASHVGALAAIAYCGFPFFGKPTPPGVNAVVSLELTVEEAVEEDSAVEEEVAVEFLTYVAMPAANEQPMDASATSVSRDSLPASTVPPPSVPATEPSTMNSVVHRTADSARQPAEANSGLPTSDRQHAVSNQRRRTVPQVAHLTAVDVPARTLVNATPVRNPRPQYPVAAIRRRIEGRVVLRVAIATDGQVSNVEVVDSSGFGILDNAATNALWRWRFNPATRGGQFVESTVLVPVRFRLN